MEILWKGNSPETLQKLYLSKKFLYQEIRWNYGIVAGFFSHTLLLMCDFAISFSLKSINPFFPNAPFLYPLKTSENRKVFWCFQWVEKGCIGNKRVQRERQQVWEISRLKLFVFLSCGIPGLYIHISSIMRQKGESQNDSYKKTKHTKFSEKTNIFDALIRTHVYAYFLHPIRIVHFSKNLVCFVFL